MLSDLKKISRLITKRDKWNFVILFILMITAAFLEAASIGIIPVFIGFLVQPSALAKNDFLAARLGELPNEPTLKLVVLASFALLLFTILKNTYLASVYYIQSRFVYGQLVKLSDRMFRVYQKAPYSWFLQRSSSEIQRNIQFDTSQIINGLVMSSLDLILGIIMSLGIILVMIFSTPSSTTIVIFFMGIALLILTKFLKIQLEQIGKVVRNESKESIKSIQQGFGAFVDARIAGCESHLAQIHQSSLIRFSKVAIKSAAIKRTTPLMLETIAIIGMLLVLVFLIQVGDSITDSLPTLSVIAFSIIRLKQITIKLANSVNRINECRPYIPNLVKDIDELEGLEKQLNEKKSENTLGSFNTLELSNVNYAYPNSEKIAIRNISLKLNKGESIAFVGSTGCGKSTLVNCILGLLVPQSGKITVNGHDIQKDPEGWRNCLGYIPQTIYLLDDTLRANIAFGVPQDQIDEECLHSALTSAALAPFVDDLPEGLDTVIGERGVRLSGGQRQRLGIARALYFNPQVLVMDEATSALDNQTEAEVMQAIQNLKKERTLIMIAHRLSTVKDCDCLYFLEDGVITDAGCYQDLTDKSIGFRKIAAFTM